MSKADLKRDTLYEGVKSIIDLDTPHIHLTQQKLYTLFSVAFNYFLFQSQKNPGHYIIRVENSQLLEKLIRKSKDESSRRFLSKLALPRKLKYERSMFHLDFFHLSSWAKTNELPKDKVKGALIVKSTHKSPMQYFLEDEDSPAFDLPQNYYHESLLSFVPQTIAIAFDEALENTECLAFDFIKEEPHENLAKGVNLYHDIDLDKS